MDGGMALIFMHQAMFTLLTTQDGAILLFHLCK